MVNKKILFIIGTRPEALKLVPLILKFKEFSYFDFKICVTNQHSSILNNVLKKFNLLPDYNLRLLKNSPDLNSLLSNGIKKISKILDAYEPILVIVQGDTISALIGGLSAYYKQIRVAHIEAGLRSFDLNQPWPEEFNRRVLSIISHIHFTPTDLSKNNLINEKINKNNIYVTGNTIIDTLKLVERSFKTMPIRNHSLNVKFDFLEKSQIKILFTCHRRENFQKNILIYLDLLVYIIQKYNACAVVINHPNPNSRLVINQKLSKIKNIKVFNPLNFEEMTFLYNKVDFILSDSGGIQEEAPSFQKKVLVMRNKTERPEGIDAGYLFLLGDNLNKMKKFIDKFIMNNSYKNLPKSKNPYGDGNASNRIVKILNKVLS